MNRDALIAANVGLAYTVADSYLIPGNDREELRQEACLALCKAADTYDSSRGAFADHAAAVVRRQLSDLADRGAAEKRGIGATSPLNDSIPDRSAQSPFDSAVCGEIREALLFLTTLQQNVIHSRFVNGFTQDQTAHRLGVSHQAVAKTERRALRALTIHFC